MTDGYAVAFPGAHLPREIEGALAVGTLIDVSVPEAIGPGFRHVACPDIDDGADERCLRLYVLAPFVAPRFVVEDDCTGAVHLDTTDPILALRALAAVAAGPRVDVATVECRALRVHATCPVCEFDGNTVPGDPCLSPAVDGFGFDHSHNGGRGGYLVTCDGCGGKFLIPVALGRDLQADALILIGEA